MFDAGIAIIFCVNEDLFFTLGIIEAAFVVSLAALGRGGLDAANLVIVRMLRIGTRAEIGRHLVGIIDRADDDRIVRVPLYKVNDQFLSDAWCVDYPPSLPRPGRTHPNPA